MKSILSLSLILCSLSSAVHALEVTPGSSCASYCLASSNADINDPTASFTDPSEIACRDLDFSTKDNGARFQGCLECLQKSDKVNETESDQKWFLYNLRYAVSNCLFSVSTSVSDSAPKNKCATASTCLPFQSVLSAGLTKDDPSETYDYCTADGGLLTKGKLEACLTCLQDSDNQVFMSNFLTALEAGCTERVKSGMVIGLSGSLFSKKAVSATEPARGHDSNSGGRSGLSQTAVIGITVGVCLLLLVSAVLFLVYWRRHNRRSRSKGSGAFSLRSNASTPDPHLPPAGRVMSESLRSFNLGASLEKEAGAGTNGEYYDQMQWPLRGPGVVPQQQQQGYNPATHTVNLNAAIPTHRAYDPSTVSRNAARPLLPPTTIIHQYSRSDPSGSYTIQPYVPAAAAGHNPSVAVPQPSHARTTSSHSHLQRAIPPPPPPPQQQQQQSKHSKVPSLSLPSVPKVRMPKQYTPPQITNQSSSATSHDGQQRVVDVQISGPIMSGDTRFHDRLVGTEAQGKDPSPLRSGRSILFGGS